MKKKRICRICKKEKSLENDFYRKPQNNTGFDFRCKECHCKQSRERLRNCYDPKKEREKHIERRLSRRAAKSNLNFSKKYPQKYKAGIILRNAVRLGKIIKTPCIVCGNKKTEGHHENYSKQLEVIWLCVKHHREIHRK